LASGIFSDCRPRTPIIRARRSAAALAVSILSDEKLAFARALKLPTFEVVGMTLLKRMALVIDGGV